MALPIQQFSVGEAAFSQEEISAHAVLVPQWSEFAIVAVATIIAFLIYINSENVTETANFVAPTMLTIALALGSVQLIKKSIAGIWTPIFWIRISGLAFIGVGSIVPYFLNSETRNFIEAFFSYYPVDVAKYNLVNCLFFFVLMLLFSVMSNIFFNKPKSEARFTFERSALDIGTLGTLLLGIGLFLQIAVIFPSQLGLYDTVFPAVFGEIAFAGQIGLFLLTYHTLQTRSVLLLLVLAAASIFAFTGLVLFAKSSVLFPLVMVATGFIYHKPTLRRIVISSAVVLGVYAATAPMVSFGRAAISDQSAADVSASLDDRLDAIFQYVQGDRLEDSSNNLQIGWARLSYVNVGTFAINQFDQGQPGDSLKYLAIVWVPRAIFPSKPIITDIARDFNNEATGSRESSASPGLAAESYWNYGWWGVPLFAFMIAVIFVAWSHYSFAVVTSGAWHLFFVALIGMRMGTRIDGFFVSDIVGPIAFAVLGHIALQFLNRLIASRNSLALPSHEMN